MASEVWVEACIQAGKGMALSVTGRGPEVWGPGVWAVLNGKVETGSG